jgi:4-hydroxy 2-oxovalerate aldolase/long-chain acyl-CoA synthetase
MDASIRIVETTLRDGSYEVEFQFTAEDSALIAAALDRAGFSYLELCHGNGIGVDAWPTNMRFKVRSAATDEAHLAAVQAVVERAAIGVILVPPFTPETYLDLLPRYGVKFVRLALTPQNFTDPAILAYIERGKRLGLLVSVNLMQTPALPPARVAEGSREAARRGADWFYVVDSAGGLTPSRTQEYVRALRDATDLRIGLHAHNNSGLAMANSLAAVEAGATLVDSTLQGIGRATGNPSTEQLLLALQHHGHEVEIVRDPVLRLGEMARSLFAEKGNDPTHFVSGAAGVHSRAVPTLYRLAEEQGRSPREFILRVGTEAERRSCTARDRFSTELIDQVIATTPHEPVLTPPPRLIETVARRFVPRTAADLADICEQLFVQSYKRRKTSVLHLVHDAALFPFTSMLPWENGELVGATISLPAEASIPTMAPERMPEVLVTDPRLRLREGALTPRRRRLHLSFQALLADASADLIQALCPPALAWIPEHEVLTLIAARLTEGTTSFSETEPLTGERVLLAHTPAKEQLSKLRAGDTLVLLGGGPDARAAVDDARARSVKVLRPLLGPSIASKVSARLALADRLDQPLHSTMIGPLRVVDPFLPAAKDEIVVDAPAAPTSLLADDRPAPSSAPSVLAEARIGVLWSGDGQL